MGYAFLLLRDRVLVLFASPNKQNGPKLILVLVWVGSGWFLKAQEIMSREILHIWGQEKENANSHHKHLFLMQRHICYDIISPLMKSIEILSSLKKKKKWLWASMPYIVGPIQTHLYLCWTTCPDTWNCILRHAQKKNVWQWKIHVPSSSLTSKHKLQWNNSFTFTLFTELVT